MIYIVGMLSRTFLLLLKWKGHDDVSVFLRFRITSMTLRSSVAKTFTWKWCGEGKRNRKKKTQNQYGLLTRDKGGVATREVVGIVFF